MKEYLLKGKKYGQTVTTIIYFRPVGKYLYII